MFAFGTIVSDNMTTHPLWTDDLWPLLLQIYNDKPAGVKPVFSRRTVNLALELHIPPQTLYSKMFELRNTGIPHIAALWQNYAAKPEKLARAAAKVRKMRGFYSGGMFYDNVKTNETFETDFRPISGMESLMPVTLIIILDLYFRLTPVTMAVETPEVIETARALNLKPGMIVSIMRAFSVCDPYLRREPGDNPLTERCCREIWNRYGNGNPAELAALAAQLKEFFKTKNKKRKTRNK